MAKKIFKDCVDKVTDNAVAGTWVTKGRGLQDRRKDVSDILDILWSKQLFASHVLYFVNIRIFFDKNSVFEI